MRLKLAAALLGLAALASLLPGSGPPAPAAASPGRAQTVDLDTPDPHILRADGGYFAYTTNKAGPWGGLIHVPVLRSDDLETWTAAGDAFPNLPRWVEPGSTWAPTVFGHEDGYALFYSATERRSGRQCIGRARANSPTGPFRDRHRGPVLCQRRLGGSIDPYVFRDHNGRRYLLWKNDGNCCGFRVSIWAQRLRPNLTRIGEPRRLLNYDRAWERPLIENPAMVHSPRGGEYRLFYAANWWASRSYATGYARCRGPLGPCRKVTTSRPWYASTDFAWGPGGAAFFTDPVGHNWMAVHGWARPPGHVGYRSGGIRSLFIEKVNFSTRRPRVNAEYPYEYHVNPPHPFVDLPLWVDPPVTWAWQAQIETGWFDGPDRTFRPGLGMMRGEAVEWLVRSGLSAAALTQPRLTITRGQVARLFYEAAGEPDVSDPAFDHELTDVPAKLRDPVRWILHDPDGPGGPELPITFGYPDLTFRPAEPVNRAVYVTLLWRFRTLA